MSHVLTVELELEYMFEGNWAELRTSMLTSVIEEQG